MCKIKGKENKVDKVCDQQVKEKKKVGVKLHKVAKSIRARVNEPEKYGHDKERERKRERDSRCTPITTIINTELNFL